MLAYFKVLTLVTSWFDGAYTANIKCYIICRLFRIFMHVVMEHLYLAYNVSLSAPI